MSSEISDIFFYISYFSFQGKGKKHLVINFSEACCKLKIFGWTSDYPKSATVSDELATQKYFT